jgi:hypothetical protein
LGVERFLSPQAQRLVCQAGASWSFDVSAKHLKEFCGLNVSDNTIREYCQRQASDMAQWQRASEDAHREFVQAVGDVEFTTDGTSVNTWEGWREMRLGIFSKRPRGEAATAEQWAKRQLPPAKTRVAFAAIEDSERFGKRWGRWAQRLCVRDMSGVSVLADGARWIWDQAALHFGGAAEVLDIYHALEHVADTAKALYGEGSETAQAWSDKGRQTLLQEGWPGILRHIMSTRRRHRNVSKRKSLRGLSTYLENNQTRLNYAQRLSEGRSIGSGQAEGACKHMIGRRLKQTGARWRFRRVNRMATVCCLLYSDHWDTYWNHT